MVICVLLAHGCSGARDVLDLNEYSERSVASIYNEALAILYEERYGDAAKLFEEVERQYPYSWWATKAQMMAAFAYYHINEYQDAILTADRFIGLHPGHRYVPYAYYLKGMSYYEQIKDVARDQRDTELALDTFRQLVDRYPESIYAQDAVAEKIDVLIDNLAGKEMEIGRFYLKRGKDIAALNRFNKVIRDYDETIHVVEALHRLVESYLRLGLVEQAKKAAAVLGHNYPKSEWYSDSYYLLASKGLVGEGRADRVRPGAISVRNIRPGDLDLEDDGKATLLTLWQQLLDEDDTGFRERLAEKQQDVR
ncbi:MAG: outer membrane protein assembly factor BamD [Alphaproteobacteria bacterium GM7ARS4]|nr:outer membrane protein assembly factor BamD [Alphaproteobacteria bacterium GM7ARS4]